MLGLCYNRLKLVVVARSCCTIPAVDSVNQIHCFQKGPLFSYSFSSKSILLGRDQKDDKARSFRVSYLIDSFGLSPELALSVYNKHRQRGLFTSPKKPDAVIKLLKDYGLSDAHISEIAKRCLGLFSYDAEKTLLPKLEFLSSIGIPGNAFARMLCSAPIVLTCSLERCLKPCYDISTTLGIPKEKLPYFFTILHFHISLEQLSNVAHNVSVLRAHGVPESSFPLWQPLYAKALSFESEKVEENVKKVISMGFCPSSPTFMRALYVISLTDASKWKQKVEFYNKWGWTEDDILVAFRKSPLFVAFNEKNISKKLDFYIHKMGLKPSDVAGCPDVLNYSLEKRIKPRLSVLRVIQLKGLYVVEDFSILTILQRKEKWFMEMFVLKYQEKVPELLSISQGKMSLADLGLDFDGRGGVKHL